MSAIDQIRLVTEYVDNDQTSSRQATMRGKTQIAYATNSGDDDMFLSHTTILRGVNHLTLERNRQTNLVEQAVAHADGGQDFGVGQGGPVAAWGVGIGQQLMFDLALLSALFQGVKQVA